MQSNQPSKFQEAQERLWLAQNSMQRALDEIGLAVLQMQDRITDLTAAMIELHQAKEKEG